MKEGYIVLWIAVCCVLSLKCIMTKAQCPVTEFQNADTSTTQVISSPRYPLNYPKNQICYWSLRAPYGFHVQLNFTVFNTFAWPSKLCQNSDDYVEVYDSSFQYTSKKLGRYCGSTLPATVVSTSRFLFVKFSSSSWQPSSQFKFQLKYKAVKPPYGASSTCSPFNLAGTNANIRLSSSSSYKYIESPLYPNKYPSNIKCTWYITASSTGKKIQLYMSEVKVYSYDILCTYSTSTLTRDVLTVRDGSSDYSKALKTICNPQTSPQTVTSSGRSLTITFTSNERNYFPNSTARFKMRYREIARPEGSSLCSPSNTASTNNNIRLRSSSLTQYIKSPWYPYQYPSNIQCTWYITASSSSKRIELTLSDVKIYNKNSYSCSRYSNDKDILIITDGPNVWSGLLKTVCSRVSFSTVQSTGRSMTIRFETNAADYFLSNNAGFNLKYREYEPDSNVGMILGIVFGVLVALCLVICCACICKRKGNSGHVHRVPAATTVTTSAGLTQIPPASQYPMQGGPPIQGSFPVAAGYPTPVQLSYPPDKGSYPPFQGSYLPPQGSYPPPQGSYPPPQGIYRPPGQSFPPPVQSTYQPAGNSYPPPINDPIPSEPPPQYPGINVNASQATPPYNPQFQGSSQTSPPYPTGTESLLS